MCCNLLYVPFGVFFLHNTMLLLPVNTMSYYLVLIAKGKKGEIFTNYRVLNHTSQVLLLHKQFILMQPDETENCLASELN